MVAVFNWQAFGARFPELIGTGEPIASALFAEAAALYIDNSPTSIICQPAALQAIMNLATAHLIALNKPASQGGSDFVGRVASATEGTVSVDAAPIETEAGTQAWWSQTKYGFQCWTALQPFRTGGLHLRGRRGTPGMWPYGYRGTPIWN